MSFVLIWFLTNQIRKIHKDYLNVFHFMKTMYITNGGCLYDNYYFEHQF